MTSRIAATLTAQALTHLDEAFDSEHIGQGINALQNALSVTRQLAGEGVDITPLVEAVNETRVIFMARGWA